MGLFGKKDPEKEQRKTAMVEAGAAAVGRTLQQDVEYDTRVLHAALVRPEALLLEAQNPFFAGSPVAEKHQECAALTGDRRQQLYDNLEGGKKREYDDEAMRSGVMARVAVLTGAGNMQVVGKTGATRSAADNFFPVASYLEHGSRVVVEIPKLEAGDATRGANDLFHWVTSGQLTSTDTKHPMLNEAVSKKNNGDKAAGEGKVVYNRGVATHSVTVHKGGRLEENKLGAASQGPNLFKSSVRGALTENWGMDVAMGGYGEKDIHGATIGSEGNHGHLYIRFQPPTLEKSGVMMLGVEGSAPLTEGPFSSHSIKGTPNTMSATGGLKWKEMEGKLQVAQSTGEFADAVIPRTLQGMNVTLTPESLKEILDLQPEQIDRLRHTIASAIPQRNGADFMREAAGVAVQGPAAVVEATHEQGERVRSKSLTEPASVSERPLMRHFSEGMMEKDATLLRESFEKAVAETHKGAPEIAQQAPANEEQPLLVESPTYTGPDRRQGQNRGLRTMSEGMEEQDRVLLRKTVSDTSIAKVGNTGAASTVKGPSPTAVNTEGDQKIAK